MLRLTSQKNAVLLRVKVVPGASRTRYLGVHDDAARIAVAAPPEKSKANKAVIALLADLLGLKPSDVTVASGHAAARKTIRLAGTTPAAVRSALESA